MQLLLIGLGGAVGALLRYGVATAVQSAAGGAFPLGTLVVNALGCLAIGAFAGLADARGFASPELRALVVVGLLGGFTTFSAFANETLVAWREGHALVAAANVALSVGVCLAATWLGRALVS